MNSSKEQKLKTPFQDSKFIAPHDRFFKEQISKTRKMCSDYNNFSKFNRTKAKGN